MKRGSASLIIREMQIKKMRCHLTPVRGLLLKRQHTVVVVEDVENRELLCTAGGKAEPLEADSGSPNRQKRKMPEQLCPLMDKWIKKETNPRKVRTQ